MSIPLLAEPPGLAVRFEDEHLLVVDKPSGLLSQPGRTIKDSVSERVRQARPTAQGSLLVHRLDMDTSGLLLLGKTPAVHSSLQRQFERRTVGKRYHAVLENAIEERAGQIELPLRLDVDDRPRQIVCWEHGKASISYWRNISSAAKGASLVLYPRSGRTHQLRVHLASEAGLGNPVKGDRLYGREGGRLMLHASGIAFDHPVTGQRLVVQSPVPFPGFKPSSHCVSTNASTPGDPS